MVRVEYRPVGEGGIVIPPPGTWPSYTIPAGEKLEREGIPPNLQLLTEKPQWIQIEVSIFRRITKRRSEGTPR